MKLPARIDGVERVFLANKKPRYGWSRPDPLTDREKLQAKLTGWRNIKDWIDAQMALLETEMVKIEEIFLPYVVGDKEGHTMYERFENGTLQLESGS